MDQTNEALPGSRLTWLGVVAIVLGILAMLAPGLVGASVAMMVGVLVLAGGIVHLVWAFQAGSFGRGALLFLTSGLTVAAGLVLLAHPILASGVLALLLAAYFIVDGAVEIGASFRLKPGTGWGWLLFAGIVSVLLGLMIWQQFPLSGMYAVGILLGIKLFFVGVIMTTTGETLRALSRGGLPRGEHPA